MRLTTDWDKKPFPPSRISSCSKRRPTVPPDAWVACRWRRRCRRRPVRKSRRARAEYIIKAEPTFFVDGFHCTAACPADRGNTLRFRGAVKADGVCGGGRRRRRHRPDRSRFPRPGPKPAAADAGVRAGREPARSRSRTPASSGSRRRAPTRSRVDSSLRSADGQTLGYTWSGTVENWHERAFTSFGDGHGVWERSGGKQLPFYARNFRTVTQWVAAHRAARSDADDSPAAADRRRRRSEPPFCAGAAVAGQRTEAERHAGPDPVARPRSVGRARQRAAPAWCGRRCEKASRSSAPTRCQRAERPRSRDRSCR